MTLSRLKWYAARLAAMSPPEVLHRVREAMLKRQWRGNTRGWSNFDTVADAPLPAWPEMKARLARGAAASAGTLAGLDAGAFHGLGRMVAADAPGRWFADPVTGTSWPGAKRYCFDIDVRATGVGKGDVKFVWEINRLQFLHALAARIASEDGAPDSRYALDILHDWARANPPYRGVNWFSGIELSMRLVTLTLLVAAIPPARLTPDDRLMLRRMVVAHGFWLQRYPSRYSSANNHLVAEGLGLLLAGLLVPDHADAPAWQAEGTHILETEAALQIEPAGVGGEQSPTYQAFTMEMLAFGLLAGEQAGLTFAPIIRARLAAGATFLTTLMDTAGFPPRIGDDDEGRVIGQPPDREPRYVASVAAAVAGMLAVPGRRPLPPARDAHLRDALFGAPATGGHAADGVHRFNHYTIIRSCIAGRQMVLTFDHGPLGYLSLAAHGHADALAVWMSLDDQPVFVDAGTYLYHSGGALRNALRASAAHNTVTVAAQSQSVPSSAFSWSRKANAIPLAVDDGPEFHVSGQHSGYRARLGVTHKRRIDATPDGFMISDMLEGATAPLMCEVSLLLAPGLVATIDGQDVSVAAGKDELIRVTAPDGAAIDLVCNRPETGQGLYSPAFGQTQPAQQIVFRVDIGATVKATRITICRRAGSA